MIEFFGDFSGLLQLTRPHRRFALAASIRWQLRIFAAAVLFACFSQRRGRAWWASSPRWKSANNTVFFDNLNQFFCSFLRWQIMLTAQCFCVFLFYCFSSAPLLFVVLFICDFRVFSLLCFSLDWVPSSDTTTKQNQPQLQCIYRSKIQQALNFQDFDINNKVKRETTQSSGEKKERPWRKQSKKKRKKRKEKEKKKIRNWSEFADFCPSAPRPHTALSPCQSPAN